jgi:hypothetical protein
VKIHPVEISPLHPVDLRGSLAVNTESGGNFLMEISVEASQSEATPLGRLVEEHQKYSQALEAILAQPYLSDTEQIEAARLKKLKLKLKDQMAGFVRTAAST